MCQKIKYLDLYKKEYSAFKTLESLPKNKLLKLAYLAGMDIKYYSQNKNLLSKGLFIALGGHTPVNFDKW